MAYHSICIKGCRKHQVAPGVGLKESNPSKNRMRHSKGDKLLTYHQHPHLFVNVVVHDSLLKHAVRVNAGVSLLHFRLLGLPAEIKVLENKQKGLVLLIEAKCHKQVLNFLSFTQNLKAC